MRHRKHTQISGFQRSALLPRGSAAALSLVLASAMLASPLSAQEAALVAPTRAPADTTTTVEALDLEAVLRGGGTGLTADQVAAAARRTAPSITRDRALLAQARSGAAQAYLAFFPQLEFTARYTRLSPVTNGGLSSGITAEQQRQLEALIGSVADPSSQALFQVNLDSQIALANFTFPVLLDQFSIGGQLNVPISDLFFQVMPMYEAAERGADAQAAQMQMHAAEASQTAREAFYSYARARAATAVAEETVRTIEAQERVLDSSVAAGAVARVDLMRLRAQLASARVAVERARGGTAVAAEALRMMMHVDGSPEIDIAEDLLAPLPPVTESREDLALLAMDLRPEALALGYVRRARDRQIEAAEGSRYPHFLLSGALSLENPNNRIFPQTDRFIENWSVSAILSWSPNALFAGEERARYARAERSQTDADLDSLRDVVRMQVAQAYENLRASRLALEAAQSGIEAADEGVRVRTEQLRAGSGLITELMSATADRARAQLDLVSAAIDARIAYAQLQRATGRDGPYDLSN